MSTTLGWYREGGPIMLLILLVGLAGLFVLVERFYVIVIRSKNNGRAFIEKVIQLVRAGKVDDAIKVCVNSTATLPDMGLLILRSRERVESDLQTLAGAASLAVLPKLTRRLQYLPKLAMVSLLLGLLGTVHGVHGAADASRVRQSGAMVGDSLISAFAAALAPTAFGLVVAAVLVLGYGYVVSQSEAITEDAHEFSARLISALTDGPDVRLGHR
ncbi:MAG TPA: MotA/TolQ/ExbB proton channel family protein [Gemmatimonadaceae bacterium]|nr:MotA/TolQ/ExbB proton channel family protein [Gemmatimonadaceae bacterium]